MCPMSVQKGGLLWQILSARWCISVSKPSCGNLGVFWRCLKIYIYIYNILQTKSGYKLEGFHPKEEGFQSVT